MTSCGRRIALFAAVAAWLGGASSAVFALDISNRYRSPRNAERKVRASTELIVLHTTEAPAKSSLNKLCERGEAHYCVTEEGRVYRIVDRDREAFHAGRSMWNGKEDVDKRSIGIECVGYHDKAMGLVQLVAIRDLVKELKRMYRLSDDKVVCHSHVAYGAPNKWQKRKHRGRKRCGMLFAMPSVRRVLDLKARPGSDADVKAKRLVVGDPYLNGVLFGKTDTMRTSYPENGKTPVPPAGKSDANADSIFSGLGRFFTKRTQPEPEPAKAQPKPAPAKPVTAAKPGAMAKPKPGGSAKPTAAAVTKPGAAAAKPKPGAAPKTVAELRAGGWLARGKISPKVSALRLVGAKWNAADTYYTIRDKVVPGDRIDAKRLENGMIVWTRK